MNESLCPTVETIQCCLNGMLTEEKCERLEQHFENCQRCKQTVHEVEQELASQDSLLNCLGNVGQHDQASSSVVLEEPVREAIEATLKREALANESETGDVGSETPDVSNIVGDYEILSTLGRGGMGIVFLARHRKLGRHVALKILTRRRWQDDSAIARFTREMKIVGRMEHAAMVSATDAGKADGVHYLVMEWVDGLDLRRIGNRLGSLANSHLADACEIIRQAACGMQYAHQQGVVHRDVKPSNLMLDRSGKVKVLDLGLAKLTGVEGTVDQLTTIGQLLGTLDYMAPEQCEGNESSGIACDIYGLGATLYQMLCGTPPYGDSQLSPILRLRQMANSEPTGILERLPDLPPELAVVIERCLARNPSDRFASASELATALADYCVGHDLPKLLDLAIEEGPVGGDLPTLDEVDREFENAASDIRKFRKERSQRRQARWVIGVVTAMAVLGGVAFLTQDLWLQEFGSGKERAQPSTPGDVEPSPVLPESNVLPKPDAPSASPEESMSPPESEGGEVVQELQSALVVVAPFESVRLKLTRDDAVVKEWTMANKTETIRLPAGEYYLRQLSHLDRLKLDRAEVVIRQDGTQMINLIHSGFSEAREATEVVDVEGVPQKDLDSFIDTITPQLSASVTKDGKAVVIKGEPRSLRSSLGLYRDTVSVRTKRGLAIGVGPKCQWYDASEYLLQFARTAAGASLSEPYQLTSIQRYENSVDGFLKTQTMGLPGPLHSIVLKGKRTLVLCELPVSRLKEGRSQLVIARSSLLGKLQTLNFDFEPSRIFASNVDNDWFYRIVEAYQAPDKLQKFSLTSGNLIKEVALFPNDSSRMAKKQLAGISADGKRLLFFQDRNPVMAECDFDEVDMVMGKPRSFRFPFPLEQKSFSNVLSTTMSRNIWDVWDPEKKPVLFCSSRAVHPTHQMVVSHNDDQRALVIQDPQGKDLHRIQIPPAYPRPAVGWTTQGNELAVCIGNRIRLMSVADIVATQPIAIRFKAVSDKVRASVGNGWTFVLDVCAQGERGQEINSAETQIVEGPEGLSINDLKLSWTPTANEVGKHRVVVKVTAKIPGVTKDSPDLAAEGRFEFEVEVKHRSFEVPRQLSPTSLSDNGQYVLMTKTGRFHSENRTGSDVILEMAVFDTRDGEELVTDKFENLVAKTSFIKDYLFVFFANHPEAVRYDLKAGTKKVFPLDLGADLNRTRKTTGLPFSERNVANSPPPNKHQVVDAVTKSGDQLRLHYRHGYWLSKWDNVLAVRDVLDIEDLSIDLKQRRIAPFGQVATASCPEGSSHFANRLFDQRTGKLTHNVACRWLPSLSLDPKKVKAVDDYLGPFGIPVVSSDDRWRQRRDRMQNLPRVVRSGGGNDIIWQETSVPLSRDQGVTERFGAVIGIGSRVVVKNNFDRLMVIDWPSPQRKDEPRQLSKEISELFDFSRNEIVFETSQPIRLHPALTPKVCEREGFEIELLGDDRFLKWDGKQLVFDVVAARKQYVADCQANKMWLTNKKFLFGNTLTKSTDYIFVFDDPILFEELAGQPLPQETVAFQYPIRYRVKIAGASDRPAVDEVVHQNIILLVPRSDFAKLPEHRSKAQ